MHTKKNFHDFNTVAADQLSYLEMELSWFEDTTVNYCVSEWVSSFLTAHQHIIGHSVP